MDQNLTPAPSPSPTATIVIAAGKDKVWRALTDARVIPNYLPGTSVESDWLPGSGITWMGERDGKPFHEQGTITVFDLETVLAYTLGPGQDAVTITIRLDGGELSTEVSLVDSQATAASSARWSAMLDSLRDYLESTESLDSSNVFLARRGLHGIIAFTGPAFMHRSRLTGFIIDCRTTDLDSAARFWAAALGRAIVATPADSPSFGKYTELAPTRPDDPLHIEVQKVSHPSRVHLDIETDDISAEVARLETLGAKVVESVQTWVVMEAPTGQRFCVVRAKSGTFGAVANVWDSPTP